MLHKSLLKFRSYTELYIFYLIFRFFRYGTTELDNSLIDMMLAFHSTLSLYKIKQSKNVNAIAAHFSSSNLRQII